MRSWMIAYLAGVLLFHMWGEIIPIPYLMAALGLSVLICAFLHRISWLTVLIMAVAWSSVYSDINKKKVIDEVFESTDLIATGYVCSIPKHKGSFIGFELCNTSVYKKDMPERRAEGLRLKLNWYTKETIRLQGVNTFTIRIKKPHGMVNPGGFLYEKWLFRKGIHGVGYVKTNKHVQGGPDKYYCNNFSLLCYLTAFRIHINEHLSAFQHELVFMPVIKALSIGYRGDIPDDSWALLKNTGTQHLIAISGLHIGLVYGAVFLFFMLVFRLLKNLLSIPLYAAIQRNKVLLCTLPSMLAAFFYSAMAGFSVSTQRALLMILVFVLCRLLRLGLSANTRLMIAAVLILMIDPNSVLDYGFWLSFLAVWVLFFVASAHVKGKKDQHNKRLTSWLSGVKAAVNMQWVICVGLCPVLLVSGMGVSYTSMMANFVAIPLVSLFTVPLVFISLIVAPFSPALSSLFLYFSDVSLRVLFKYLTIFGGYSGISLNQPSTGLVLAITLSVLFILVFPLWRAFKLWAVVVICILLGLRLEHPLKSETELIVLDVGQGLSVVAINGVKAIVYDTGPEYKHGNAAERSLIPFLKARGVKDIEMLVLSHGDSDHAGGLASIQSELSILKAISGEPDRLSNKVSAELCVNNKKVETHWYKAHFFFLAGEKEPESLTGLSSNNHSCVLKLQFDDFSVLLMGDLEGRVEKEFVRRSGSELVSDILVAGHHGSKHATGYRLLNAASPQAVVFSAGYKSRFNHPHPSTVQRVRVHGADIFNTASDGAIIFTLNQARERLNNRKWKVKKQREIDDAFWMF